ncbi:MAG: helix-turn-helix domain-containing protein [Bacteroidales bacterium]|nr:helix-turn-helix domain-containing protein [Bacteroidales bacterium]
MASALYFGHYCYFSREESILPITDTIYSLANLSVYPLYYTYIKNITSNKLNIRHILLYLLPAMLVAVGNAIAYALEPEDTRSKFIHDYLYHETISFSSGNFWLPMLHSMARIIFPIQVIICLYFGTKKIKAFNNQLKDIYSDTEARDLSIINILITLMLVTSIGSIALSLLSKSYFSDNQTILVFPSIAFSTLLFLIGHDAYHRQFTAADIQREIPEIQLAAIEDNDTDAPTSKEESSAMPEQNHSMANVPHDLADKLLVLLRDEKLYLIPDLKITDIAQRLQTNRNYTYYAITVELKTTFADLVNSMRIEYAQQILTTNPHINMYELMTQSGYSSESTFFRNFKKITGKTPKMWIEESNL